VFLLFGQGIQKPRELLRRAWTLKCSARVLSGNANGATGMKKKQKPRVVTIGSVNLRRKGTPRPHLNTHPNCVATRWTKETRPAIANQGRPKQKLIVGALLEGLDHEALINGEKSGITVAEAIASTQLTEAMNGHMESVQLVLDRTEGPLTKSVEMSGPGGRPIQIDERMAVLTKFFGAGENGNNSNGTSH
jgi:hypothetical protein